MIQNHSEAVFLSAVRTPSGRFQGSLSGITAPKLGAIVIRAAVERSGISNPADIDEVLMGNVVTAGAGQAPARQSAIFAGLPASVGATTINKVCGSGLKTVMLAAHAIQAGDGDLFVAGGMESMSRVPYLVSGRSGELRFGHLQLTDALLHDGLWDPFENWGMGNAAEFIADEYEVTRQAMDEFALASHQKALAAIDEGQFKDEIVPVEISGRKGEVTYPVAAAEEVALKTAANHSSMLQDVLRGAPTEIDAICGALVQAAQKHNIPVPVNWTCWKLDKASIE